MSEREIVSTSSASHLTVDREWCEPSSTWTRPRDEVRPPPRAFDLETIVEEVRDSIAANQPIIGQPRQPSAVRVYVPGQQTLPVPVLAVFDVGDSSGKTRHLAVLLAERSRGEPLIALETAALDAPEPPLEVDGNGYARLVAPPDQATALGRNATDLPALFGGYLGGVANGSPQPSPAPFSDGPYTSQQAQRDASFVSDVHAHKANSVGSVQLDYTATAYPVPVFALRGGGGLSIFATQRNEVLQPVQGQLFAQDASRHNYGIDLAPGQYPQITIRSIVVIAAKLAGAAAPVQVLGGGGGVYSAG